MSTAIYMASVWVTLYLITSYGIRRLSKRLDKKYVGVPLHIVTPTVHVPNNFVPFDVILYEIAHLPPFRRIKLIFSDIPELSYPATGRVIGINDFGELLVEVDFSQCGPKPLNFFHFSTIINHDNYPANPGPILCAGCDCAAAGVSPRPCEPQTEGYLPHIAGTGA